VINKTIVPPEKIFKKLNADSNIIIIRHAERVDGDGKAVATDGYFDPSITEDGRKCSFELGKDLPIKLDLILTTSTARTIQTAEEIKKGNGSDAEILFLPLDLWDGCMNFERWSALKKELGWKMLIEMWVTGKLPADVAMPHDQMAKRLLRAIDNEVDRNNAKNVLVVMHDQLMSLLASFLFETPEIEVPFLHGFCIDRDTILAHLD
jgi:broad specificity phosphatase PhoE